MPATPSNRLILLAAACLGLSAACQQHQDPAPAPVRRADLEALPAVAVPDDLGRKAMAHVEALVGFGARDVGSKGWGKAVQYLHDTLQGHGVQVRIDRWTDEKEKIEFRNVVATIPGRRQERIVIGAHHDTKRTHGHPRAEHNFDFVGANDSGSGCGLLLALAPVLAAAKLEATIELVFFDGEESLDWEWNKAERALFGSRRYVKQYRDGRTFRNEPAIVAFVLLDMVGRKDLRIDDETNSTPELRDLLYAAAKGCGEEKRFRAHAWPVSDDHLPFLEAGIPALDIIDLHHNPDWHKPTDTLDRLSPDSLHLVGRVVMTLLPAVHKLYLPERRAIR